jgi:hypothetical protein
MSGEYHFQDIESASVTEDGQNIILNVTNPSGKCGVLIPEKSIGRVCGILLEASSRARKITGDKTIQASEMQAFGLLKHPDPEKAIVTVTLHTGAAPLALTTTRKQLIQLARGILETEGQIESRRAGPTQ